MAVTCLQLQQRDTLGSKFLVECFRRTVVSYSQINHQKDLMRVMRNLGPGANDPCPKSLASYNDFLYSFSYIGI